MLAGFLLYGSSTCVAARPFNGVSGKQPYKGDGHVRTYQPKRIKTNKVNFSPFCVYYACCLFVLSVLGLTEPERGNDVKVSKNNLCGGCRGIYPVMDDGKRSEISIEKILDSPGYNSPAGQAFLNEAILLYLEENGGCFDCKSVFKRAILRG